MTRKYTAQVILSTASLQELGPWSLAPALLALVAYLWSGAGGDSPAARRSLPLAWAGHGVALLSHLLGIGENVEGARFGFAPALTATAWLVVAVYGVESRFVPLLGVRRLLSWLGFVTLALMLVFPGATHLHPASPWAPLHWLLGLASYGLFGVAVLHAVMLDRADRTLRQQRSVLSGTVPAPPSGLPLLTLEALTFQFVRAGFAVLSAAIVLGVAFTTAWHWDHKTVFSVLGWLVFAALLTGRHAFGWRGRRATRWVYVGAALLLLAYAGSRFVFEVLLQRTPA